MKTALAKHDSVLKEAIMSNNGRIIKTTGDGVHAVFATAIDAVNATIIAQRELYSSFILPPSSFALKVRMGLHTGEADQANFRCHGEEAPSTKHLPPTSAPRSTNSYGEFNHPKCQTAIPTEHGG